LKAFSLNAVAMNRLWMAMGSYVLLAVLAWTTLTAAIPGTQFQVRHVVLVILAALTVSTWMHRRDHKSESGSSDGTQ
jgi:hypothetical protein